MFLDITALEHTKKVDRAVVMDPENVVRYFSKDGDGLGPFRIVLDVEALEFLKATQLQVTVDFHQTKSVDPKTKEQTLELRIGQMGRNGNLVDLGDSGEYDAN